MDVLIRIVVIISQCICILKYHAVHLTYIQHLFVNHTSIKLGQNKCFKYKYKLITKKRQWLVRVCGPSSKRVHTHRQR